MFILCQLTLIFILENNIKLLKWLLQSTCETDDAKSGVDTSFILLRPIFVCERAVKNF